MRLCLLVLAMMVATPALADQIAVTKTATVVSDPVGDAAPKSLPGALVDYKILATNPVTNLTLPVKNVVLTDTVATTVKMYVLNLVSTGPVEFLDGSVLGLGLGGSGLSVTKLEYYNGTVWTYVPVADSNGCDVNIRAIRVTLATTFNTSGSFQLRYRVMIR
jgi:hypothetical protein